jgi:SAM-dependent methyltransferase
MSWADVFVALPRQFQFSANPAELLESLLADRKLLNVFLFASFLPDRFYGNVGRYPGQFDFIRDWLESRSDGKLKGLDVACGSGEETYRLATLISQAGFSAEAVRIDGWTVEPLEVWSATYRRFPHNLQRELSLQQIACNLSRNRYDRCISFSCRDILQSSATAQFDLVLCNGLLGGPIIHSPAKLDLAVGKLSQLLLPGGMLLVADSFHGGWKQQCPQTGLQALFEKYGLKYSAAGEGICGLKHYQ